ncbi:MAG: glutamine synthetase [Actinomycetota bacterium]|jgi:glutamine synthetase|nr:MAG: glutamine synthetase [Actinomycetota bacterium]
MDIEGRRLRLLYPDIHGLERGKYLFGEVAETGRAAFCIGVYPLTHDREILPVPRTQFDVGLHDFDVELDRDSLRPSWEPDTVIGIGDARLRGEPVPVDPRHALRRAVEAWRERGLEPQVAFELEFFLLEPHAGGDWGPVRLPGHRVYGTGTAVDPTGCVDHMVSAARACGFPVETWNSEYDEAAYEVNIRYADAISAADDAFVFRLLVREIAERHGVRATFLGRPLGDRGGSGMHVNLSFRRDDGSNAFHDPNDPEGLSDLARQCIAGLLEHHRGTSAILAPHVNAYKRLQPDMLNGYWANWGHDDRSVKVRVPPSRGEGTRLEDRTADAAANPYLVGAALLHAARFGVEDGLALKPPQPVGAPPDTDVHVPDTLAEGLDALAADERLVQALGPELVEAFTILKRAEWERYAAAVEDPSTTEVTDWELRYYLPFH